MTEDSLSDRGKEGEKQVVLLIDDQAIVAEAIRRMLADQPDLELVHCSDVARALPTAREVRPSVVLQDLVMPGADGFTLVRYFRADPQMSNVPIIVLSSKEEPRDKSRAFELGASDYLVKIPDRIELLARIRAHVRSFTAQRERDEAFRALSLLKAELEEKNVQLQLLTVTDGLTGLANRRHLDATLDLEWRRCQRERASLSLLLMDIDYFKKYNDAYGHPAGDACLQEVAAALKRSVRRPADLVARYGGEEFAVVLPSTPEAGAATVASALRMEVAALQLPHRASDIATHVTLSLGVAAVVPGPGTSVAGLIAAADGALYDAKRAGRNRHAVAAPVPVTDPELAQAQPSVTPGA
jgi:two-component system chemotaxis family response regulator WspR